jgi:hypothetical protein
MDAAQFTQYAQQDPRLNAFLQEIAADVADQVPLEEPQRYITVAGVDILIAVAAYALYRWLKDYFDHRRALNEAEILRQQEQVVAALVKDGFTAKEAKPSRLPCSSALPNGARTTRYSRQQLASLAREVDPQRTASVSRLPYEGWINAPPSRTRRLFILAGCAVQCGMPLPTYGPGRQDAPDRDDSRRARPGRRAREWKIFVDCPCISGDAFDICHSYQHP